MAAPEVLIVKRATRAPSTGPRWWRDRGAAQCTNRGLTWWPAWHPEPRSKRRIQRHPHVGQIFAFISPMTMQQNDTGLQRDPDEWKTGDEPMTAAQRSYLETLCHDNNETFDENLTKAEASKRIDELRERSPRLNRE